MDKLVLVWRSPRSGVVLAGAAVPDCVTPALCATCVRVANVLGSHMCGLSLQTYIDNHARLLMVGVLLAVVVLVSQAGLLRRSTTSATRHTQCDPYASRVAATSTIEALQAHGWSIVESGRIAYGKTIGEGVEIDPMMVTGAWEFPSSSVDQHGGAWPLGPADVILAVGCAPPAGSYFSYGLFTAFHRARPAMAPHVTPAAAPLWAPVSPALNVVSLNLTDVISDHPEYGPMAAVAVTSDRSLEGQLMDAAEAAGMNLGLAKVPATLAGILSADAAQSTLFQMLLRVSKHRADLEYFMATQWTIVRMRAPATAERWTYKTPLPATPRPHDDDEDGEQQPAAPTGPALGVDALQAAVIRRMQKFSRATLISVTQTAAANVDGRLCIMNRSSCAARPSEVSQFVSTAPLSTGVGVCHVVVGYNPVAAGSAAFASLQLMHDGHAFTALSHEAWERSATLYMSGMENHEHYYVVLLAATCGERRPCMVVPASASDKLHVVERVAASMVDGQRPAADTVVPPRVLTFEDCNI